MTAVTRTPLGLLLLLVGLLAATLSLAVALPAAAQPFTCNGLPATIVATTPGRIDGTDAVDVIIGTSGDDLIVPLRGDDIICAGDGNDTVVWNPGEGSDTIEGQAGSDLMEFNGAGANENIDLSANGGRLRFFRDVANITMDTDDVERVLFAALGGADRIVTNDLSGTDVTEITYNLAAALGGATGDAQADQVVVNATNGDDVVVVSGSGSQASVVGLAATIWVLNAEGANDSLVVNALAGDDAFDGSGLLAGVLSLTADGGAGDDVLIGSAGADTLLGGADDDVLIGGPGVDVLDGGTGNNVVIQD
jgi:Ca2+-binding RTX toxin-like protein